MNDLKYDLSKILTLKFLIVNLILPVSCFGMENILISDLNEQAKKIFGVFDPESKIDFKNINILDSKKDEIEKWNNLLLKITGYENQLKNQDLKCLLINPINKDRCKRKSTKENPDTQILTIYDLNQEAFTALKGLYDVKTDAGAGLNSLRFNSKFLSYVTPLSSDLKKINNFLSAIKQENSSEIDISFKKVLEGLLKIYEAILDKIKLDFTTDGRKLISAIDVNYQNVFAKHNFKDKFGDLQKKSWGNLLINIQRLVFASEIENLICLAQNPNSRCKTKDGKDIFTIFDLSTNFIAGSDKLADLYKNYDPKFYDEFKKIYDESKRIIDQINKIIKETEISNNIFGQSAKSVLENLMKKFELLLNKLESNFIGPKVYRTKEITLKDIDVKMAEIFKNDLSEALNDYSEPHKRNIWNQLLFNVRLFVQLSGSQDLPKLLDKIEDNLGKIFSTMFGTNSLKKEWDKIEFNKRIPKFTESVYNPLKIQITDAKKLVNGISTFKEGPRAAKEVLIYLINKIDLAVEQYKLDWQQYLGKFKI